MITPERIRTYLFWFLLLQCCSISVSIAAASMLFSLSVVTILALIVIEKKWIVRRTPLDLAFLAYVAIELITAVNSVDQIDAFKNAKRLLLIAIVYGVAASFDRRHRIELALVIIAVTVSILSTFEVILFVLQGDDRLTVFQHYMTTGGLKMIAALMVVPFVLDRGTAKKQRIIFSFSLVPILAALILTNTRSAWLGLLAGMLVIGALYYRSLFSAIAALIVLFFLFAPPQQLERAKSIVDMTHPNNVGRLTMWTTGIQMWSDKPILGYGDIDLYQSYSQYRTPGIGEPAGHLHNNYIHLLVTLGAIGFMTVMWLFYSVIATEYSIFRKHIDNPFIRNTALGGLAIFSGFLVNGLFEWNFGDHEIMVFVWYSVGLVLASAESDRGQP
ncbi:MAG: O-antigen ligase family protein [Bacteroidota bacterium]